MTNQRIDKLISSNSAYSRKEVAKLIKQKLVTVADEVVTNAANKYPEDAMIKINGEELLTKAGYDFVIFHKPKGYVCANEDSNPTIFDILPERFHNMHSVGRLDKDTSGLLFITSDGQATHRITSPKKKLPKVYQVWLEDEVLDRDEYVQKLQEGLQLIGEKNVTLPAEIEFINSNTVYLKITEGKYHQVKRMFAALGNKVVDLHRVQIGNFILPEDLEEGDFYELSAAEALNLILDNSDEKE